MKREKEKSCAYVGLTGERCQGEPAGRAGLCFWHDPGEEKKGRDVKRRLEEWARSGRSMEGFRLPFADLSHVDLTAEDGRARINLSHADLSRANLTGAHLYNIDLRGSTLLKAKLAAANLNRAMLENADLLGANLDDTRLENVVWGKHVKQEDLGHQARSEGQAEKSRELYVEAEEVYRILGKVCEGRGYFAQAGRFFQQEMVMRRMQLPRWRGEWVWSKVVDLLCGYGERADRVIGFSVGIIVVWAALFFLLGVSGPEGALLFDPGRAFMENVLDFLACLYFSVVTFTTLGYGEITPVGITRLFAASEAFIGAFTMALFVVVFLKKMTR